MSEAPIWPPDPDEMNKHLLFQLHQKCTTHPADVLCNICDPNTPTYVYTVIGRIMTDETHFKMIHKLFKRSEKLTENECIEYVEETQGNGMKFIERPSISCMRPPGQKEREANELERRKKSATSPSTTTSLCSSCHKIEPPNEKFKRCSRCKTAKYCSSECQRSHWKKHKKECKRMQDQRKEGSEEGEEGEERTPSYINM